MTKTMLKIRTIKNIKVETLNMTLILSIIALAIFYLFMANNVVMNNYHKTILEKNINNIRTEIRTINLKLANKRSIGFLKKAAQELNLVVNESVQYIKITGPVAKNF